MSSCINIPQIDTAFLQTCCNTSQYFALTYSIHCLDPLNGIVTGTTGTTATTGTNTGGAVGQVSTSQCPFSTIQVPSNVTYLPSQSFSEAYTACQVPITPNNNDYTAYITSLTPPALYNNIPLYTNELNKRASASSTIQQEVK